MKRLITYIGLLRGINVAGHNKIPMYDLCTLCAKIGYGDVQTYIQSGNLVFSTSAKPLAAEIELEQAIMRRFHLQIPVIVRAAADWPAYVRGNPFPEASRLEPNAVMLALAHQIQGAIDRGEIQDRAEVARRLGLTRARLTQLLGLTLLAPDIQEAILFAEFVEAASPTERDLRVVSGAVEWRAQRRLLARF